MTATMKSIVRNIKRKIRTKTGGEKRRFALDSLKQLQKFTNRFLLMYILL